MFVGLRNVSDTLALSLKATIYDMLSKWNLSPSRIRGQGYDGASNTSGAFNGLKTLIMNEIKSVHFVHYFAHQLQLALVFVVKNTTRKIAFYDVQSMTRADRVHVFERALKIDVSFPKYEAYRARIFA